MYSSKLTQNAFRNNDVDDLRKPIESNHEDPLTLLNAYRKWLLKKESTNLSQDNTNDTESSKVWTRNRLDWKNSRFIKRLNRHNNSEIFFMTQM